LRGGIATTADVRAFLVKIAADIEESARSKHA